MRHLNKKKRLGRRTPSQRKAMLNSLAISLIKHKRIKTTHARAKELRRYIEPLITFAKRGDVHARRQVLRKIHQKDIVHTLFHEIAPVYSDRNGGYTRIIKLGFRDNDRAKVSLIEMVDMEGISEESKEEKKTTKKRFSRTKKTDDKPE